MVPFSIFTVYWLEKNNEKIKKYICIYIKENTYNSLPYFPSKNIKN